MSMINFCEHSGKWPRHVDEPQIRVPASLRYHPEAISQSRLSTGALKQKCLKMPVDKRVLSSGRAAGHRERLAVSAYNENHEFEMAR
jgi:hypothetical protein